MIFILIISKGHNSAKNVDESRFFFYPHHLVTLNICIKFHENILDHIKVIEWAQFSYEKFQRGIIQLKCKWSNGSYLLHIL